MNFIGHFFINYFIVLSIFIFCVIILFSDINFFILYLILFINFEQLLMPGCLIFNINHYCQRYIK